MNELIKLEYEGKPVRTVEISGESWWVLNDVCEILELKNPRDVAARLDSDERADVGITDTSSNGVTQKRSVNVINESGLYSVIFESNKLEAKAFKQWVKHLGKGLIFNKSEVIYAA